MGVLVGLNKERDAKGSLDTWNGRRFSTGEQAPLKVTQSIPNNDDGNNNGT